MPAQVVVFAGPSGVGKSRHAQRTGLPVLRLDDFYRSAGDPALPLIAEGPNAGIVDWDDPASWLLDEAAEAIAELCRDGRTEVPVYEIAQNGRCGSVVFDLRGAPAFVAEGIFAQEVVPTTRAHGVLAGAYCLRRHPLVTFWRRLVRDLREHRKPPLLLLRRGLALLREDRSVVAHAAALGCEVVDPETAVRRAVAIAAPQR